MRNLYIVLLSILSISAKAQISNLPKFNAINGVSKTVMNPKLYPLLLKVHVSENNTNTTDFKNFISHLKHFEVFTSDNLASGDILFTKVNSFINTQLYTKVNPDTYELVSSTQKEYIIIKRNQNKSVVIYAFTTKLEYKGIKDLKLM